MPRTMGGAWRSRRGSCRRKGAVQPVEGLVDPAAVPVAIAVSLVSSSLADLDEDYAVAFSYHDAALTGAGRYTPRPWTL
jgi:hypothetical protein